jgi:SAM-dependent methyltransferase
LDDNSAASVSTVAGLCSDLHFSARCTDQRDFQVEKGVDMHSLAVYMHGGENVMAKIKVLDIGSGTFPYKAKENEEVISVDFRSEVSPTVVHNLFQFPWPFEDNSFDAIYASHIMEHMKDNIEFMEEIYRIARPNAKITICVPHYSGRSAWCDPTHQRAYSYYQFYYYGKGFRDHYGECDFQVKEIELHYIRFADEHNIIVRNLNRMINALANLNPKLCEKVWCYWVGGLSEIYVQLQAIKK